METIPVQAIAMAFSLMSVSFLKLNILLNIMLCEIAAIALLHSRI
jgi:hypothetical protein